MGDKVSLVRREIWVQKVIHHPLIPFQIWVKRETLVPMEQKDWRERRELKDRKEMSQTLKVKLVSL